MKRAVRVFLGMGLLLAAPVAAKADSAAGEAAFKANNCQECHYTQGPAQEKTIADQMAKKGPELWYAGSKFQKPWLAGWLQDPQPIRPLKYNSLTEKNAGDHPKLAGGDAANVTDFLMGLTSDAVKAGVIKPKKNVKGKMIFTKKQPCSGCHLYPDRKKISGGLSAPTLVGAKKRLNPDWIYAYMTQPKVFKPVKMMPVFTGILQDKDIKNVSAFVANFK
ncbi:MAG: c-type cytochrome [Magnetococcales bacterium]|nr:c-type cytochrome [Magnetococcales bacterium]